MFCTVISTSHSLPGATVAQRSVSIVPRPPRRLMTAKVRAACRRAPLGEHAKFNASEFIGRLESDLDGSRHEGNTTFSSPSNKATTQPSLLNRSEAGTPTSGVSSGFNPWRVMFRVLGVFPVANRR